MNQEESVCVLIIFAHEDARFADTLNDHLSDLQRQAINISWVDLSVKAHMMTIDQRIRTYEIILLLISSDFLASDFSYSDQMKVALNRHSSGETRVIPIILRPTDWKKTPFGVLQALPRDGKPVSTWQNLDEAFLDIAKSIRATAEEVIFFKEIDSAVKNINETTEDLYQLPLNRYQLFDVFKKSGVPEVTFVEREDFEALKLSLAHPGRGVVIEGPSGVGKTTVIEKAIEQLVSEGRMPPTNTPVQKLSARRPDHIAIIQTLQQEHKGTVVVDDFHRLDPSLRTTLSDYMKYLADTSSEEQKLVIVGIPQTHQILVDISPDLAMRIDVFELGKVKDELVLHMIEKDSLCQAFLGPMLSFSDFVIG